MKYGPLLAMARGICLAALPCLAHLGAPPSAAQLPARTEPAQSPAPTGAESTSGLHGAIPDSIPDTTPGLPPRSTVRDKTRRDFGPNCFEGGCHAQLRETRWLHGPLAVGACQACHLEEGPAEQHRYRPARAKGDLCTPCHAPREPRLVRHEPFARSECVLCHNPHGGTNKALLVEPSLTRLCDRCHDGQEHGGKVIADGPREVAYPHEPVAKGDCAGCHVSHQSDHQYLLVREPQRDLCLGCHRQMIPLAGAHDGRASGYVLPEPLPIDTTPAGAGLLAEGVIPLAPPPDSAFYYVTGPLEGGPPPEPAAADTSDDFVTQLVLVHQPVTADCGACHAAHGSNTEDMLLDEPPHLCVGCHEDLVNRLAVASTHHAGALDVKACSFCHAGHSSPYPHLLVRSSRDLCLSCHNGPLAATDGRRIPGIQGGAADVHATHDPTAQACVACHLSHASSERRLLRPQHLARSDCVSCHHEAEDMACGRCHPAQQALYSGEAPRWNASGAPDFMAEAEVECQECHDLSGEHSVLAVQQACVDCHEAGYDETLREWIGEIEDELANVALQRQQARLSLEAARRRGVDTAGAEKDLRDASETIDLLTRGRGAHNYEWSLELLEEAGARLEEVQALHAPSE